MAKGTARDNKGVIMSDDKFWVKKTSPGHKGAKDKPAPTELLREALLAKRSKKRKRGKS